MKEKIVHDSHALKKKTARNTSMILMGILLGVVSGLVLKQFSDLSFVQNFIIGGVVEVIGTLFLNSLRMIVIPLVFVSIVCGMNTLKEAKEIGRISFKTFIMYIFTTLIALVVALSVSMMFNLGGTLDMSSTVDFGNSVPEVTSFVSTILSIVPQNIFSAFTNGDMLAVLFFAIFFGACITMCGDEGKPVATFFKSIDKVLIKMVNIIISFAPICVYCLMTKAIFNVGAEALWPLIKYFLVFLLIVLIQAFVVYGLIVVGFLKTSPIQFYKKFMKQAPLTFSVSVSSAVLPVSMDTCSRLGVPKKISAFSLPLGATINMDGTAIIQAVSVVFLAGVYQIDLSMAMLLQVIVTGLMISIGSPAVPGGSHITLALILATIGIPIEGIALIMGFERLAGMTVTVLNVMGDVLCATIVAKTEKTLNMEQYHSDTLLEITE